MMGAWMVLAAALNCTAAAGHDKTSPVNCSSGDTSTVMDFPSYGGPSAVEVLQPAADTFWVVRSEAGGSDIHFWWWPLRIHASELSRLLPAPVETSSQDAVCATAAAF